MIIIFGIVIILLLSGIALYVIVQIHNVEFIKSMSKTKKLLSWLIASIPIFICIIAIFFGNITAMVILLHFAAIMALCNVICVILKKLTKKTVKKYVITLIALIITIFYITYGVINMKNVEETDYSISTSKSIGAKHITIAQITDTHIGNTFNGNDFQQYINDISKDNPDIIVVTGDFVDERTSKQDMIDACANLGKAKSKYGTFFVLGNHDLNIYGGKDHYTGNDLITCLKNNGIHILQDQAVLINNSFYIIGRQDKTVRYRKSTEDLMKSLDSSKYTIVLDHQPNDYENENKAGADLVLSGHTHGGQIFPGALIDRLFSANEMNYGTKQIQNTHYIVSSGISGWGIPIKTGAKSEYVLINIETN